jgi:flagellin
VFEVIFHNLRPFFLGIFGNHEENKMASPLAVNTNVGSLNAQRNLASTGRAVNKSIQRLSSGLKINSASDDAAGIAVAEGLRAQVGGFQQAAENANDAVALLATAEGSYNAISDIMVRMRELAVQSSTDTLTDKERAYIDTEYQDLSSEITRISDVTEYNGINLLDASSGDGSGNMVFQVGTRNSANDQITIALKDQDAAALNLDTTDVGSLATSQAAITAIDTAIDQLATDRATLGSTSNELTLAVDNLANTIENLSSARSQIEDADIAAESAQFTKNNVLMQAGVSMLAQANSTPQMGLRLLG